MHETILHGEEMAVKGIDVLFCRPAEIAVIEDEVGAVLCTKRILFTEISCCILISHPETDVSNDEVLRSAAVDFVVRDDDTYTGRCLSGDGVVLTVDTQVFDEPNLTGHSKTDGDGFVGILLHRPTE